MDPALVMVGTLALKLGGRAAFAAAVSRWKEHASQPTEALKEAMASDGRKWRAERDHLMDQRLAVLEAQAEAHAELAEQIDASIQALTTDDQFFRLERNYEFEAAREATDERRRMLAFAAAWSADPDLSMARLARVERTIRELDPDDVAVLRRLADLQQPAAPESTLPIDHPERAKDLRDRATGARLSHQNTLFVQWNEGRPRGEVLSAAGCVLLAPGVPVAGGTSTYLQITQVGFDVLRVLTAYTRSNAP